ncbi:oligosaccharide flippase family protein [Pedobacter sp.]
MSKSILLKNTIIYSIGEIFPKLVSFLLLPIFTSYLSEADYGIISYTNSVMFFLFVFSALALNTYLLREFFECKTEAEQKRLIGSVFFTILAINVIILILGYLFGPTIIKYTHLQIPFYPFFSLLLLNNFCEALSIVPLVVYRVHENALAYVIISILRAILIFAFTYAFIIHLDLGILGNFYGRLFVNAFFVLIYLYIIFKNSIINIDFTAIRKSLVFSLPLIPGAIGYLLMNMSDRIILERYVSLSDIGIYSVAYTLAYSLTIVIQSGYRSFEPEIYRRYDSPDFNEFVENIHKVYMFVVYFLALMLVIFAKDVLQVMTKGNFIQGYILIPLIVIGVIATAQNAILISIVISEKNTKLSGLSTVIGGFISIGFNLLFIPQYGTSAAALASSIAYISMNVIVLSKMKFKSSVIKSDFLSFFLFIIVAIVITLIFGHKATSFLTLCLKLIISAISFVFLFLIYRLKISEFNFLLAFFTKPRKNS